MKAHIISEAEYKAAKEAEKRTKDKHVSRRLKAIILRYEGFKNSEIAEKLDYSAKYVSQLFKDFKGQGIEEYAANSYGGNHRLLSKEEENEILNEYKAKAEVGEIISVQEIKAAFDKKIGRDTGSAYIYYVLKRHGWRKIMPRSKHPKSASPEAVEASKKLTTKSDG